MKKRFLLMASILALVSTQAVFAQSTDILELENEIIELTATLNDKKAQLKDLKMNQAGIYIIETNNATFAFSNPRVHENLLLLDLDLTNDTKGLMDAMSDLWMLSFSQETETSINQLWYENFELPEVEGRNPLNYNMRIKSGATVNLVIGLSQETPYYPYYSEMDLMVEEGTMNGEVIDETTEVETEVEDELTFDNLSTLYISVDSYSSPTGQSERIEIPLN